MANTCQYLLKLLNIMRILLNITHIFTNISEIWAILKNILAKNEARFGFVKNGWSYCCAYKAPKTIV